MKTCFFCHYPLYFYYSTCKICSNSEFYINNYNDLYVNNKYYRFEIVFKTNSPYYISYCKESNKDYKLYLTINCSSFEFSSPELTIPSILSHAKKYLLLL